MFTENDLINVRNEIRTKEAESAAKRQAADEMVASMRAEGKDPSSDADLFEKVDAAYKESDQLADDVVKARQRADRIMEILGHKPTTSSASETEDRRRRSPGSAFVDSEEYGRVRELAKQSAKAASAYLASNPIEVGDQDEAVAMLDPRTRAVTMPASPSAAVPADYREPVETLFAPTRILQLITTLPTESDTIEFVVELAPTVNVAETAYGTALSESDYVFDVRQETLKRIGHLTKVTEAQLADAKWLRGFLDTRMPQDVRRTTEARVVAGTGGAQFTGILNTTGIGNVDYQDVGHPTENGLDAIHRAITACRLANVEPNGVAIDPVDFETYVVLAKDSNGNYLFKIGEPGSVWGKPTAVTTAVPNGTALVGDFSFAILNVRTPIVVLASTEDADNFQKGIVTLKAEYRAGFYVQRPAAFCEVTTL